MYFRGVHNLQRGRSGLVALTGCYGAGDQSLFVVVFFFQPLGATQPTDHPTFCRSLKSTD